MKSLVKELFVFVLAEFNPIKKITLLESFIERSEQVYCFQNTDTILIINAIMVMKMLFTLRYFILANTNFPLYYQWLWYDIITFVTGIKTVNYVAFLIELCSVYMFKRFYHEYHEELFNILKYVLFRNSKSKSFFIESKYKNKLVINWIHHKCNTFMFQLFGIIALLGNFFAF